MGKKFDRSLIPERPDLSFETALWGLGLSQIAGVDEAGRGALAGPVAAAALILPADPCIQERLPGVRDSKQMTPAERETCAGLLREAAIAWGIGFASSEEIDQTGIVPATRLAVQRALAALQLSPQHILVDYLELLDCPFPQTPLVKGDARSLSIAGASVLAKTARDALLCELDAQYPGYSFSAHKGYCTACHLEAIRRLGPTPVHRMSFEPLRGSQR
jgi:ribonuclease HII